MSYESQLGLNLGYFGVCFFLIVFSFVIINIFSLRKSKRYRQELGDIYVAAKIKEIATNEKLDLNEEFIQFNKWVKNEEIKTKDYDLVVEEELSEKIAEKLTKSKSNKKE